MRRRPTSNKTARRSARCRRAAASAASAAVAAVIVLASAPGAARADDSTPLRWDAAWSHAGPTDYALTALAVEDIGVYLPLQQPDRPPLRWTSPILFDEPVRDLLRAGSPATRSAAGTASWGLFAAVAAYPEVDIAYAWARYGRRVAWDLFWQDATTLSLAATFDLNVRDLFGRARPPVSECLMHGGGTATCLGNNAEATRSFPGGHVLIVSTAASLSCTQHVSMRLYGSVWDGLACASAVVAATTVGVLRIVSDDHWASDILAGELLGTAIGWGIPTLMHFHRHAGPPPGAAVTPIALPLQRGGGLGVTGIF
jgi:membrane-associated phospholipid phosphatase